MAVCKAITTNPGRIGKILSSSTALTTHFVLLPVIGIAALVTLTILGSTRYEEAIDLLVTARAKLDTVQWSPSMEEAEVVELLVGMVGQLVQQSFDFFQETGSYMRAAWFSWMVLSIYGNMVRSLLFTSFPTDIYRQVFMVITTIHLRFLFREFKIRYADLGLTMEHQQKRLGRSLFHLGLACLSVSLLGCESKHLSLEPPASSFKYEGKN